MKPPLDSKKRPTKVTKRPLVLLGVDMATNSDSVNTADVEPSGLVRAWNGDVDVRTELQRAIDHAAQVRIEAWLRAMGEDMVLHVEEYRDTFVGADLAIRTPPHRRTVPVCRPNLGMTNDLRWILASDNSPGCPPEPHDQRVWETYGRMASRIDGCPLTGGAGGRQWFGPLCDELTGIDQRDPEALMYGGVCGDPPSDLVPTEPADEMRVRGLLDWDTPEINYVERMGAAGRFFESYVDGEWFDAALDPAFVGRHSMGER